MVTYSLLPSDHFTFPQSLGAIAANSGCSILPISSEEVRRSYSRFPNPEFTALLRLLDKKDPSYRT